MTISELRRDHPVLHPDLHHGYETAATTVQDSDSYVDTGDLYPDVDAAQVARERVYRLTDANRADHADMMRGWASL